MQGVYLQNDKLWGSVDKLQEPDVAVATAIPITTLHKDLVRVGEGGHVNQGLIFLSNNNHPFCAKNGDSKLSITFNTMMNLASNAEFSYLNATRIGNFQFRVTNMESPSPLVFVSMERLLFFATNVSDVLDQLFRSALLQFVSSSSIHDLGSFCLPSSLTVILVGRKATT
jgi:hypothetical protein